MNYYKYYTRLKNSSAKTFQAEIKGYSLKNDAEPTFVQYLNIKAIDAEEAYQISELIRDNRLNQLHLTTTITDIYGGNINSWNSEPGDFITDQLFDQDVEAYSLIIIREAGVELSSGIWADYAEEHFTIHATNKQEAYIMSQFISTLQFKGQLKHTIINGTEYFDRGR